MIAALRPLPTLLRPRPLPRRWRGFVLPLLILVVWETASRSGAVDHRLLPSLVRVAARAWTELSHGNLPGDLAASLERSLAGFAVGAVLGLAAGLAFGLSRWTARLVGPSFDAFKQIALFAWIPLIAMWFGMGETSKIVFIALAAFTPVVVNSWEGAANVPVQQVEIARVLNFGPIDLLFRLILPAAAPSIFAGLHLALIYAWLATIGAEYFMTIGPGIGSLMMGARERFEMDLVLLCVLLLGAVGLCLNQGMGWLERRALRWRAG